MDQLHLNVQKDWLEIQKQTVIRLQKPEETILQTIQEQGNLLELTNKGHISENENAFSENMIRCAMDNFTYRQFYIFSVFYIFAAYFRRFEDLNATYCANWADSMTVCLQLRKLGTTEHTKFFNYILPSKISELTFTEILLQKFTPS